MSPRTFVTRGATLLALATLGLAACETKTIVQPPPENIQVFVTPSTATLTTVGQTVQFVAQVTGTSSTQTGGVTWTSSNTAVATVAATGNTATVTAKANGIATITATSTDNAARAAAATVTVAIAGTDTTKVAPPTVSIASITTNSGAAVDVGNVQGLINVTLNVDVPTGNQISSVNWLIDGKVVCSQTFTSGKSAAGSVTTQAANAVTMSCQINTASLTSGAPTFANGSHTLSATLVGPTGTTQASTTQALVFNNPSTISLATSTTKTAIGANGLLWNGGNLTVTASPVIFTGETIARVTFGLQTVGGTALGQVVDSTAADGFTATFRGDTAGAPLTGISDSVVVTVTSVTTAGTQGPPMVSTPTLRFDNLAPAAVQFFFNDADQWKNGAYKFISAIDTTKDMAGAARAGVVDNGVDRVTYTFSAADTSRAVLTPVVTGADLADSNTNTAYAIKVVIADALGNTRTEWGSVSVLNDTTAPNGHFGIDKQAPVVVFDASNAVKDTAKFTTNPASANYVIGFQDLGASGFATANPVMVIEKADTGGGSVCVVGSGTSCGTAVAYNSQVPVDGTAGTQQGYVTMTATVTDRAGNSSSTLTRSVLVDYTPPTADSVSVTTSPLAGGAAETFRAFLTDNVSLASAGGSLQYNAVLGALNFVKTLPSVSYSGYGSFTKTATADFADPFFFRAIETSVGGAWILPAQLNVAPKDVAGNAPTATAFTGAVSGISAPTTDPFAGVTTTQVADSSSALLQATLTLTGTAATVSPATQVQFYQFDPATGVSSLVGTATNPVITVNGTQATFTFTATPTATLKPGTRGMAAAFTTSGGVALFQLATFTP